MGRLNVIFGNERSKNKIEYFEKIYVNMNKENVDLAMRLAWNVMKACQKRCLELNDQKKYKEAYGLSNLAI